MCLFTGHWSTNPLKPHIRAVTRNLPSSENDMKCRECSGPKLGPQVSDEENVLPYDQDQGCSASSGDCGVHNLDVSLCSSDPEDQKNDLSRRDSSCSLGSVEMEMIIQAYENLEKALPR